MYAWNGRHPDDRSEVIAQSLGLCDHRTLPDVCCINASANASTNSLVSTIRAMVTTRFDLVGATHLREDYVGGMMQSLTSSTSVRFATTVPC